MEDAFHTEESQVYENMLIDRVRIEGDLITVSLHNEEGPRTARLCRAMAPWSFLSVMKRWQRNRTPVTLELEQGGVAIYNQYGHPTGFEGTLDDLQQIVEAVPSLAGNVGRMLFAEPWADFRNRALNRYLDVNQTPGK